MPHVVCFEPVHIHAVAVHFFSNAVPRAVKEVFPVTRFFNNASRRLVHLPSLERLPRCDVIENQFGRRVARLTHHAKYLCIFLRNFRAQISYPGDVVINAPGRLLLIDVWGKKKTTGSVYYDITWIGYLGAKVPEKYAKVFGVVREARDAATELILNHIATGKPLQGWQVDKAARSIIEKAGYGKYFFHRTGHSIGEKVHGNGVNMDGLETHDVRHLIPRTCNSIEPGIYLPEFGVRSEVNVYIGDGEPRVTGPVQKEILALLA